MVRRTRPNQGGRVTASCVQKTPGGTRGGLPDVEHRLAGPVLGADLVSAHRGRPRVGHPALDRCWRARSAGGSEAPSASAAPAAAERTRLAESLASPAGLSDRGRVDGAAFAAGDTGVA